MVSWLGKIRFALKTKWAQLRVIFLHFVSSRWRLSSRKREICYFRFFSVIPRSTGFNAAALLYIRTCFAIVVEAVVNAESEWINNEQLFKLRVDRESIRFGTFNKRSFVDWILRIDNWISFDSICCMSLDDLYAKQEIKKAASRSRTHS